MTTTATRRQARLTVGVDTHADTHHAVILDEHGIRLADRSFAATAAGYRELTAWSSSFGTVERVAIESTGSYGAGLTRYVTAAGIEVVEVNQPHIHTRARVGKDDAIDAEAAARTAMSGQANTVAKDTTGVVESIRIALITRDSAVKSRTRALVQLRSLLITVSDDLRNQLRPLTTGALLTTCQNLRPDPARLADPTQAAKHALRTLARRISDLDAEIADHDSVLTALVTATAPATLARPQIGIISAAQLLVTFGQNGNRVRSEAAFARITGVAPIPASSGKTNRMRLHRGGDRQANKTLHMIAVGRLRRHPETITYAQRRTAEGLSKKDVIRCLKRYIAREVFTTLKADLNTT